MALLYRSDRLKRRVAAFIGALSAAVLLVAAPGPAGAGIFDFLFGRPAEQAERPAMVNSYAEPTAPAARLPGDLGSMHQEGGGGRFVAFCVRLCDGQHFPLAHLSNATPVETCRAMCPASQTKVFFGSAIDHAVAKDGARYANLDNAFVYRQRLVSNCTCNGRDAFGLARFDVHGDPTLRAGDIVATKDGFAAYTGKHGQARGLADGFTPVNAKTITAELNAGSSRARLARRGGEPAVADEAPGIIVPQSRPDVQAVR